MVDYQFRIPDFHCLWSVIPNCSAVDNQAILRPYNPYPKVGLGSSLFARRLLRESRAISIPAVT